MFKFRSKSEKKVSNDTQNGLSQQGQSQQDQSREGLFTRLKNQLRRTRTGLSSGLASLVLGKKGIDDELLEEIEAQLLSADIGVEATQEILEDITDQIDRRQLDDPSTLLTAIRDHILKILQPCSSPLTIHTESGNPFVILMVGVNGAGKTTTIGKLAAYLKAQGHRVMLAAGDTFRAAAVEQLQVWGERNDIPVVAQGRDTDPAAVIFDAVQSARAKGIDVVIADTAGRLHTQANLMAELKKIRKVIRKLDPDAPHEVMLVVDAGIGQNALQQAREFDQAVGITGIALTKMDGTAKGGIICAIANKMKLPIRFIGIGEKIDDLKPFDAAEFVAAIFDDVGIDDAGTVETS